MLGGNQLIIDAHSHVLNGNSHKEYLEKCNSDIIMCVKFFKGFCGGVFDGRDEQLDRLTNFNNGIHIVEAIDFETNILSQLEALEEKMKHNRKIKGIMLYPGYQHFYPNNERMYPVYHFAKEHKIPVIFHSGALYHYKNSQAMLKYTDPIHVDEVAVTVPQTKYIISHFGFPNMMDTGMVLNKNNNVFTDISGIIDSPECYEIVKLDIKRVLKYYPNIVDQVMFGTQFTGNDTSLNQVELYVKLVQEVFTKEEQELVFYKNAKRVFGL
jgi:predicted TIM-barrel fold metal-dependent hydrolase